MVALEAAVFDWGDTLMRDLGYPGPMVAWPRVEAVDGAAEALAALAGRLTCCVASNAGDSDAALMGEALAKAGLRDGFEHLWTSRELGATKPDPAFFRAVLARLGRPAGACVSIGNDYAKDIVPAKAAGMRTVWLQVGDGEGEDRPAADRVIGSMRELMGVVVGDV